MRQAITSQRILCSLWRRRSGRCRVTPENARSPRVLEAGKDPSSRKDDSAAWRRSCSQLPSAVREPARAVAPSCDTCRRGAVEYGSQRLSGDERRFRRQARRFANPENRTAEEQLPPSHLVAVRSAALRDGLGRAANARLRHTDRRHRQKRGPDAPRGRLAADSGSSASLTSDLPRCDDPTSASRRGEQAPSIPECWRGNGSTVICSRFSQFTMQSR